MRRTTHDNSNSTDSTSTTKSLTIEKYMRTCMLIRNDNQRLKEWLAYHYTVLPLRYIIVGSDLNSTEDPIDVLGRWNGTDLQYEVWHADDFLQDLKYFSSLPNRQFAQRQARFFSRCMQYYNSQGNLGWLALADTDEFVKLNPLDDDKDKKYFIQDQPNQNALSNADYSSQWHFFGNETIWDRVMERKRLRQVLGLDISQRNATSGQHTAIIPTVLEVLENYSSRHTIKPCFTVARLQYSAVMDNFTVLSNLKCIPPVDPRITSSLNVTDLTTIRYLYHWSPDSFQINKWGKVLIDLRRIPVKSLSAAEHSRNPHAPIAECGRPPAVVDVASFLRINHYLHDFDIYTGRQGDPRAQDGSKKVTWSILAHGRDGLTCDHMAAWLNEFVNKFGIERAKFILGQQ